MKELSLKKMIDFIKKKYLIVLAVVGVVLLIISFFPKKEDKTVIKTGTYTSEEYIKDTEEKLKRIISDIIGSDDVSVMITLNNSVENVYADITKINTDMSENTGANDIKTEQSDSKENQYIIISDEKGNEQALIVTQVMPQIRGVVIVCPNGNNAVVRETVKSAVVTVLDINSKKVCVTGAFN